MDDGEALSCNNLFDIDMDPASALGCGIIYITEETERAVWKFVDPIIMELVLKNIKCVLDLSICRASCTKCSFP